MNNNINEEEIRKYAETIRRDKERELEKEKSFLESDEFILKIISLLNSKPIASSDDGFNSDYNMLYRLIEKFARESGLVPIISDVFHFYYVYYMNYQFIVFEELTPDRCRFGCMRKTERNEKVPYWINYEDVKANRKINMNNIGDGLIKDLGDCIMNLYNSGVSESFIRNFTEKMCENLRIKEEKHKTR